MHASPEWALGNRHRPFAWGSWPSTRWGRRSGPSPPGAQESCSQRCGDLGGLCSCHPTCFGLGNCCSDLRDFCLEIKPYSGSMMGGKDFVVQHLQWSGPTDSVICRWEHMGQGRACWGPDPPARGVEP